MAKTLVIKGANFGANKVATIEFDRIHTTDFSIDESAAITLNAIGATHQIEYTITPANSEDPILWTSSDDSICTVNENGLVTAAGCGTVTITGTSNGFSDTCEIVCAIVLSNYTKAPKTYLAGQNSNDHSGMMDSYIGLSNTGYDQYMVMVDTDSTKERLNTNYNFAILDETTNTYHIFTSEEISGAIGRVFNNVGYTVPILLPNNCTKVTAIALSDKYAPCVTFFKSTTRAADENTSQKYFSAYKEAKAAPSSYAWSYAVSTEVQVPTGYDSFAILWKADTANGATSFAAMTQEQLVAFSVICS